MQTAFVAINYSEYGIMTSLCQTTAAGSIAPHLPALGCYMDRLKWVHTVLWSTD